MDKALEAALNRQLTVSHGVISRQEIMALGCSGPQADGLVRSDRWFAVHRGVYARRGHHLAPEGYLIAACLALGPRAAASHLSAAWLWGLADEVPHVLSVSAPRSASRRLRGVEIYRRDDLDARRYVRRRGVPTTDVVRTLCDVGQSAPPGVLDEAVDRALARRLARPDSLMAEIALLARSGRRGPSELRRSLHERGVVGAPHPSVLEGRVLRLLTTWGVAPVRCEAVVIGGAYRLDFLLVPGLALEVDGFTYHASPAAKAADSRRRNELQLSGLMVLQADWIDVQRHPERVRATVLAGLALHKRHHEGGRARGAPTERRPGP